MAKKNLGKKILALVLALTMCFSLISLSVYAAEKNDLSKLKNVHYDREGRFYYVNAQVYLLYQNTVPQNIQQGFNMELFGPSGNNDPYIVVKVNLSKLMENEGIKIYQGTAWGGLSAWYISYQTSTGYSAESLWECILDAMDEKGKAFFRDYFKNNYIGYVLKVENEESHIDGIYKVDPAYFTEIYIDGDLEQTYIGTEEHSFTEDVLGWFEEQYPGITWNEGKTEGEFELDGKTYIITLEYSNKFNPTTGKITYNEKTNDFYVAAFYYEITEKPAPPTEPETEPTEPETEPTEPETEPTEPETEPTEPETEPTEPETEPTEPETEPTEPATEEPTEVVPIPTTIPGNPPIMDPPEIEEIPYTVIHEYNTDGTPDGTVPGEDVNNPEDVVLIPTYEGNEYVYTVTEIDEESKTITVSYERVILIVELHDEDVPLVEIPDEDVPLADVPKTGDPMVLYTALSVLSGLGLAALSFKKNED